MLRTLGRNGFVERSIVNRHNVSAIKGRCGFVASRYSPKLFTHARLVATSTPQTKSGPSSSKSPSSPVPPKLIPRSKPKVDLKPAPLKPKPPSPTSVPKSQVARNPQVNEPEAGPSTTQPTYASSSTPLSSISTFRKSVAEARLDVQNDEDQRVLAPPPAGVGVFRRLIHHAKELIKFYWNGLKMINTHRQDVALIEQRVKEGGAPISRAEYRFMRTYREDILKLIPFLLVVVIMEELIPLIAVYVPGMLPSTTVLPSQFKRIEEKAREKHAVFAKRREVFTMISSAGQRQGNMVGLRQLRTLGGGGTKTICGVLRLATWGPASLQLWRIDQHLKHVARDDELLVKEDLGRTLTDAEVGRALEERGMITKLGQEQARRRLQAWLMNVPSDPKLGQAVASRIYLVAKANE